MVQMELSAAKKQSLESRAAEERLRWPRFLILWCHSKALKAELRVDKKVVGGREVRFLQQGGGG